MLCVAPLYFPIFYLSNIYFHSFIEKYNRFAYLNPNVGGWGWCNFTPPPPTVGFPLITQNW